MVHRQIGAILLVAGTCIGSGMIALPLVLAKLGLLPSLLLMLLTWILVYQTALISLELNLQAGQGQTLGALGQRYSGPWAATLGYLSIKILSYALLAVYLYGAASVLQSLLSHHTHWQLPLNILISITALCSVLLLMLPLRLIDQLNRVLFLSLLAIIAGLIVGLFCLLRWELLPLLSHHSWEWQTWSSVIPVVFTAFGFQVLFHSLSNYCQQNPKMLKRAFFWGSFIPFMVYAIWTSSVIIVVQQQNPELYQQMLSQPIEVGVLINALSEMAQWPSLQWLIWWVSLLAIMTSVIGVGLGLCDSLKTSLQPLVSSPTGRHVLSPVITILPAYWVATQVPNAFVSVLGFAGMILSVIAIALPLTLLQKSHFRTLFYPILRHLSLRWCYAIASLLIIVCELRNLLS